MTRFQTERAQFKTTIFNKLTANFAIVYGIVSDVQVFCLFLLFNDYHIEIPGSFQESTK